MTGQVVNLSKGKHKRELRCCVKGHDTTSLSQRVFVYLKHGENREFNKYSTSKQGPEMPFKSKLIDFVVRKGLYTAIFVY